MPPRNTPRFFNRFDVFEKMDQALREPRPHTSFQAVTLFGPGGTGKSSVAARYLETKLESGAYDTAFWVHGETTASLRQSFTDIALRLRLDGSHPNQHDDNLVLVQTWLRSTGK
jgi:replication-associated recombination protein RarA